MGREIRRVPPDWEHPRYTKETARNPEEVGKYRPLYDNDYETAAEAWVYNFQLWQTGRHEDQLKHPSIYGKIKYYWECEMPPDAEYYRERKWTAEEATHYQVYQNVSEGSPVTPHFATQEELIEYLCTYGECYGEAYASGPWTRASAERLVKDEYVPSMIVADGKVYRPQEMGELDKEQQ